MKQLSREYVDRFTRSINAISEEARRQLAEALVRIDWTRDVAEVREAVVALMQAYCAQATDSVAALAAEFYDGLRLIEAGERMGALALSGRDPAATEGAVRAFAQMLVDGKREQFVARCLDRVDYECKVAAAQTCVSNARRDRRKPRFARVPAGGETCDFCLMLASRGFVYQTEVAASHAHANCVVGDTKVSGTGLLACMRREHKGPLVHIVTRANRELTVTPNHPILTTRGWVSAGEIVESDNLICADLFNGHDSGVPNVDDEPPTIEQVFEAGGFFDASAFDCMPAATEYFHREAFTDCDVKVVNVLGLLERALKPSGLEPFAHERFTLAGKSGAFVGQTFDRERALDSLFDSGGSAARGAVSGFCLSCPLFRCHLGSPDQSSGRGAAEFNTSFSEPLGHGWTADTESASDGVDAFAVIERFNNTVWHVDTLAVRLDAIASQNTVEMSFANAELIDYLVGTHPSLIEVDDVLSVSVREESCHVYNLSTTGGWYLSSGIITHNCDCRVVPSWDGFGIRGYDPDALKDEWRAAVDAKAQERAERNGTDVDDERRAIYRGYATSARNARRRGK